MHLQPHQSSSDRLARAYPRSGESKQQRDEDLARKRRQLDQEVITAGRWDILHMTKDPDEANRGGPSEGEPGQPKKISASA